MILLHFFFQIIFFTVSKDFSSSFVPDIADFGWLSFIFLELEQRSIFVVDLYLTGCFEFTIVTYLNC